MILVEMPDATQPRASREAAKQQNPDAENPVEEARYDAEYLQRNARSLLRTSPYLVAGALSQERKKTFTLAEATDLIKAYAKREVEHEGVN